VGKIAQKSSRQKYTPTDCFFGDFAHYKHTFLADVNTILKEGFSVPSIFFLFFFEIINLKQSNSYININAV